MRTPPIFRLLLLLIVMWIIPDVVFADTISVCGTNFTNSVNNPNKFRIVNFVCGNTTFNGSAFRVDTGTPSDLLIKGQFINTGGAANGANGTNDYTFQLGSFAMPPNGPIEAWHRMQGSFQLNPNPGAVATISVSGFVRDAGGNQCNTTGPSITSTAARSTFDQASAHQPCPLLLLPPWTRNATYNIDWTNTAVGSRIVLGSGFGSNPWAPQGFVPEPGTILLFGTGLAIGGRFLKRKTSSRSLSHE